MTITRCFCDEIFIFGKSLTHYVSSGHDYAHFYFILFLHKERTT